jgi:hypothetical protein
MNDMEIGKVVFETDTVRVIAPARRRAKVIKAADVVVDFHRTEVSYLKALMHKYRDTYAKKFARELSLT